ncbi:MAG: hypothetical protein LBG90_06950, partial [Spirochaetaceae bacterium]|nr:hypothetical protein [Spirochaetaceae bacterium]
KPFKFDLDERLRIRYFVRSYLQRKGIAEFDRIVLEIMPLLKNGHTPEDQTIKSVLEDIAIPVGKDAWQLKNSELALLQ